MKGVILAGGKGTRLLPATRVMNKHLIPILNLPMILYPISTLKSLGVTEIMIVSGGDHIGGFAEFLGDGSEYGVSLTYRVQKEAGGIAQALGLAREFVGDDRVAVILGDNIFDNSVLVGADNNVHRDSAHIFVKRVSDPERFGVIVAEDHGDDKDGDPVVVVHIIEKPKNPPSDRAVTGLYIYPPRVFDIIDTLSPSARGELEITDVNNAFLSSGVMVSTDLKDSFWSDAGTPESLARTVAWALNVL